MLIAITTLWLAIYCVLSETNIWCPSPLCVLMRDTIDLAKELSLIGRTLDDVPDCETAECVLALLILFHFQL